MVAVDTEYLFMRYWMIIILITEHNQWISEKLPVRPLVRYWPVMVSYALAMKADEMSEYIEEYGEFPGFTADGMKVNQYQYG